MKNHEDVSRRVEQRHAITELPLMAHPAPIETRVFVYVLAAMIKGFMAHSFDHETQVSLYAVVRRFPNYTCNPWHNIS